MSKSPKTHEELRDQLTQADLVEQQANNQALIKGAESAEVSRYSEARDHANRLLGQARTAQSFVKLTTVVTLQTLAEVKETQAYRALRGVSGTDPQGNEIADVGTWEGYCRAIGRSKSSVDEDLKNLAAFGEAALDGLRAIGAGYRELRRLRKLPEEEREMIIQGEAVQVGDKDALVELIDDIAARHTKEKQTLKAKVDEGQQELEAARRVTQDKASRISELEERLHRRESLTPDQRAEEYSQRLDAAGQRVRAALLEPRSIMVEILDWPDAPRELRHACAQQVARLRIDLDQLEIELGLDPVDLDVDDKWMGEVNPS